MKKTTYKTYDLWNPATEDWLNKMSAGGWQLVGFASYDVGKNSLEQPQFRLHYIFKKEVDE